MHVSLTTRNRLTGRLFGCAMLLTVFQTGCTSFNQFGSVASNQTVQSIDVWQAPIEGHTSMSSEERVARLAGPSKKKTVVPTQQTVARALLPVATTQQDERSAMVAGKSHATNITSGKSDHATVAENVTPGRSAQATQTVVRAQSPDSSQGSKVEQATYQYPELTNPGASQPDFGVPRNLGSPNERNQILNSYEGAGNAAFPQNYADLDVYVQETQTGRINFGGAYNSDNDIVGQFIVDEHNFDIKRFPTSLRDIFDGTAWRGAGQTFRLELVPGANLQRYLVSFSEPYFLNTDYSFSASGYLFERQYFDWDEGRIGGRFALGRRLNQDISVNAGLRLESVNIDNPRLNTSPELNAALGNSNLFLGNVGLVRDTRDNAFLATKGTYFSATYSQAFGDYSFARGDVDYRRYRLMYERPDGSGRHTVSFGTKLGFSGDSTPIFENYFAGGFSTLRGFNFRGAAPLENGVRVGGEFQWLNTLEYMFPLTADDMIRGVTFVDFGTVEQNIELNKENFRVAPGFGFRIHMPAAGIGAPLAFDFAFPVSTAEGDDEKVFSFYLGVLR